MRKRYLRLSCTRYGLLAPDRRHCGASNEPEREDRGPDDQSAARPELSALIPIELMELLADNPLFRSPTTRSTRLRHIAPGVAS
jgi:hypothetical protein